MRVLHRLPRSILTLAAALLVGCAGFLRVLPALEQLACTIVAARAPGSSAVVANVCTTALPAVNAVITTIGNELGAETVARAAAACKLTPITADGQHGEGVVCSYLCGTAPPTATDPCPAVDAELRKRDARVPGRPGG